MGPRVLTIGSWYYGPVNRVHGPWSMHYSCAPTLCQMGPTCQAFNSKNYLKTKLKSTRVPLSESEASIDSVQKVVNAIENPENNYCYSEKLNKFKNA